MCLQTDVNADMTSTEKRVIRQVVSLQWPKQKALWLQGGEWNHFRRWSGKIKQADAALAFRFLWKNPTKLLLFLKAANERWVLYCAFLFLQISTVDSAALREQHTMPSSVKVEELSSHGFPPGTKLHRHNALINQQKVTPFGGSLRRGGDSVIVVG